MSYVSVLALAFIFHALATPNISTKTLNLTEVMRDFSPPAPVSIVELNNHHTPNVDFNRTIFLCFHGFLAVCFLLLMVIAARAALRTRQFKKCKTFNEELEVYFEYSDWLHGGSVVKLAEDEENQY